MPELPEVETFRRYVTATSLHQTINDVEIRDVRILKGTTSKDLKGALIGRRFETAHRHGKLLFISFDHEEQWLQLHFGMTGRLKYLHSEDDEPRHTRILIRFDNQKRLAFECMRLFGTASLTKDPRTYVKENGLGPDALDVDLFTFMKLIQNRRGSIKGLLLNQHLMAGLGNIYADEVLFQAGILPFTRADKLSGEKLKLLFCCIQTVLKTVIDHRANFEELPRNYLILNRHRGGKCPLDDVPLEKVKIVGRTSYYCPRHQL